MLRILTFWRELKTAQGSLEVPEHCLRTTGLETYSTRCAWGPTDSLKKLQKMQNNLTVSIIQMTLEHS